MTDYSLAGTTWDDKEYQAIQNVVESGVFTMGKHVAEYEKRFADFFGSQYAVMVNSGSSANLLMVAALFYTQNGQLRFKRGDEVIVPAVSWSTTYFPLQQYGLKVKFVDIDQETFNIDLAKLEDAITEKTKAILAVNLLGNPNDFAAIQTMIAGTGIIVLEDNCESMGAVFDNRQAGTFGLMGTFSSFFSHHISTMEGGCIVTDDEELCHILRCLRAHGWTRDLPDANRVTGRKSGNPFEESFKFVLPGYNVRPLEISGAIGIEQLKKLPGFIKNRRVNGAYFQELFARHPGFAIQKEIGHSSWFGFALVIRRETGIQRKDLVSRLMEHGIECRPIVAGNFVENVVIDCFHYETHDALDHARHVGENGFFVGNHHIDIKEQLSAFHSVVSQAL